jgi:hypothetical protein
MDQQVTREILWNIPVGFVIFLYGMLISLATAFIYAGMRCYRIIRLGTTDPRPGFDQPSRRFFMSFRDGVGQGFVGREMRGWMHYAIIVAFVSLFISTTIFLLQRPARRGRRFFRLPYYLPGIIEVR